MIIVWKRMGWLVPLMFFAGLVLISKAIDSMFGQEFYTMNFWPKCLAGVIIAASVGALGYYLNVIKRPVIITPDTGVEARQDAHTFFFIPFQYWGGIIFVLNTLIAINADKEKAESQSYLSAPRVNDLYFIKRDLIYNDVDPKFNYSAFKVSNISSNGVEVYISQYSFGSKNSMRQEYETGHFNKSDAFTATTELISNETLNDYFTSGALYEVVR